MHPEPRRRALARRARRLVAAGVVGLTVSPAASGAWVDCRVAYEHGAEGCLHVAIAAVYSCFVEWGHTAEMRHGALTERAWILHEIGDPDGAIIDQRAALDLHGENPPDLRDLSLYLRRAGRAGESLAVAQRALDLDPAPGMPGYYHLGGSHLESGDPAAAIAAFDAAIPHQPDFPWVYYLRARAREALGDEAAAMTDYGLAASLFAKAAPQTRTGAMYAEAVADPRARGFEIHAPPGACR